jgi:anaerobic selenocysteine-containing dehydrogenase
MPAERRRVAAFCPLCVSRCGCEAVVENGRLVAIEPDPSHPTGKALCAKGRAGYSGAASQPMPHQPIRPPNRGAVVLG